MTSAGGQRPPQIAYDGNQFKMDETRSADALLIGRKTYESFAGAWPNREASSSAPSRAL